MYIEGVKDSDGVILVDYDDDYGDSAFKAYYNTEDVIELAGHNKVHNIYHVNRFGVSTPLTIVFDGRIKLKATPATTLPEDIEEELLP